MDAGRMLCKKPLPKKSSQAAFLLFNIIKAQARAILWHRGTGRKNCHPQAHAFPHIIKSFWF